MLISGNGRHRAPRTNHAKRLVATGVIAGSGLALPLIGATSAHAASTSTWEAVAQCESSGNWSIDTGNGYYGGLQFSASTWDAYGGQQYAATANEATEGQQITVAEAVLASQGPGAWPVCGPQAGLTQGGAPAAVSTASSSSSSSSSSSASSDSSASSSSAASSAPASTSTTTAAPQAGSGNYTVKSGDTLSSIAAANGVSGGWQALYHENESTVGGNPNLIYPGQKLEVG
jgi:nucleoid-associated protein YgaU